MRIWNEKPSGARGLKLVVSASDLAMMMYMPRLVIYTHRVSSHDNHTLTFSEILSLIWSGLPLAACRDR